MGDMIYTMDGDMVEVVPCFTCPVCNMVTFNKFDVAAGYCGNCHWWTGHPELARHKPETGTPGTKEEEGT